MCIFGKKRLKALYATMHGRITEQRDLRGNGKELPKRMERNFLRPKGHLAVFYKLALQC